MNIKTAKILLTGGDGFVGQHVYQQLLRSGVDKNNIIVPHHSDYDLRTFDTALKITQGIDVVIHLAGTVGGIGFNRENPGSLFYNNIIMGVNLIEASRVNEVKKFVCIGTVCSYPKYTPIPFQEESLWEGYPEETNAPYGIAKKSLLVMLQAYRAQYGFNGIYLIPVNMYGPGDNFDPESSHVIPALIHKIHSAIQNNKKEIIVWGDGTATREFLYVKDMSTAIILAIEKYDTSDPLNIGAGFEISIHELIVKISSLMGFKGKIIWDTSQPNGQPRRYLDVSKAKNKLGFSASTNFEVGLKQTIDWYTKENTRNSVFLDAKKIAKNVEGWLSDREAELLYNLARDSSTDGVIVEIGSWKGKSTIFLASGSRDGNKIPVYAIDPHQGSPEHKKRFGKVWTYDEFRKNIATAKLDHIVKSIVLPSYKATYKITEPIELLFIDGAHEYEAVKKDWNDWFPKVRIGGHVAFHDVIGTHGPKMLLLKDVATSPYVEIREMTDSIVCIRKIKARSFRIICTNYYKCLLIIIADILARAHLPKPLVSVGKSIYARLQHHT